ncbi:MAG: type II secretion system protein [Kiritimatiellae bacterium]|nr:type II secretion system protein [Kiritimatiellia bacterium]
MNAKADKDDRPRDGQADTLALRSFGEAGARVILAPDEPNTQRATLTRGRSDTSRPALAPDVIYGEPNAQRATRCGSTLVELLVSMLILVIVFIGWLNICNFQAIRKESLRRLAVEKAAGYLDIMASSGKSVDFWEISFDGGQYKIVKKNNNAQEDGTPVWPRPMFDSSEPIGYVLEVINNYPGQPHGSASGQWPNGSSWAVIRLYDQHGTGLKNPDFVETTTGEKPFSTMSIFMQ